MWSSRGRRPIFQPGQRNTFREDLIFGSAVVYDAEYRIVYVVIAVPFLRGLKSRERAPMCIRWASAGMLIMMVSPSKPASLLFRGVQIVIGHALFASCQEWP